MAHVVAVIHRCQTCGKWSFAQRKPRRHTRFVRESSGIHPPAETIVSRDRGEYDYSGGEVIPPGWTVWCGPFRSYDVIEQEEA